MSEHKCMSLSTRFTNIINTLKSLNNIFYGDKLARKFLDTCQNH